jgi:hypothetical protein
LRTGWEHAQLRAALLRRQSPRFFENQRQRTSRDHSFIKGLIQTVLRRELGIVREAALVFVGCRVLCGDAGVAETGILGTTRQLTIAGSARCGLLVVKNARVARCGVNLRNVRYAFVGPFTYSRDFAQTFTGRESESQIRTLTSSVWCAPGSLIDSACP